MQNSRDADVVHQYGQGEPTFGGVYFDGDVVVALFTADLGRHADRLRPRLNAPEQFRVAQADRTYAQVEAANGRVHWKLMHGELPHLGVVGVGIGMEDGQYVVRVSVENLTDDLADSIRAAVAPDSIRVEFGSRPRRL